MTIAQYVRERRIKAQVTQGQLAHRLGVKQQLISAWERGKQRIPDYWLPDLARAIKMHPDQLWDVYVAEAQEKIAKRREEEQ